jgi:hypothetical protein
LKQCSSDDKSEGEQNKKGNKNKNNKKLLLYSCKVVFNIVLIDKKDQAIFFEMGTLIKMDIFMKCPVSV